MPEYLAPGVYVEETSFRAKSIEGVSTSTAGFVGPTRFGPTSGKPEVLTSFADFERTYGGLEPLTFADGADGTNYLAFGARAFFEEGGQRLYVARVIGPGAAPSHGAVGPVSVVARHPGSAGDMLVTFTAQIGAGVLATANGGPTLTRVRNRATVITLDGGAFHVREALRDAAGAWTFLPADGSPASAIGAVQAVYPLTVRVDVARPLVDSRGIPGFSDPETLGSFGLSADAADGLWQTFAADRNDASAPPFSIELTTSPIGPPNAEGFANAVFGNTWLSVPSPLGPPRAPGAATVALSGGADGTAPVVADYTGENEPDTLTGLTAFAAIEDISIVAAPGSSELPQGRDIRNAVIIHCEDLRYRVASLDIPVGRSPGEARDYRNETSSTHAAIYYPWVTVTDPFYGTPLQLPPSGFAAGVWARNDVEHAVFKSPANEVVRSAVDLERRLTKGQQDVLNPEGVNCLRFFPGKGNTVWGARTIGDDPEFKYLSVRRYFAYLEHSIDRGTQWVVFESNGEALWANVRRTIEDFLLTEWKMGGLLGSDPKSAYFVRCDRSTMTQNDLDNGRLVCLVGVAVVKPAEYVIFRIGQWTATAQS